jgi:rare lipoprotein A
MRRTGVPWAAATALFAIACGSAPIPPERQPWQDSGNASADDWGEGPEAPAAERDEGVTEPAPAAGSDDRTEAQAQANGPSENPLEARYGRAPALRTIRGRASYYHDSLAGNHTANGDIYDPAAYTAASRSLPFGTIVRVVRRDNDRSVLVRVNDRGPFGDRRRILDLSRAAAEKLDMIRAGVVEIRAEIVHRP